MRKKHRTVERLAEEWIDVRKTEVKISTVSTYNYILSHYIVPFLGQYRAEELTTAMRRSRPTEARCLDSLPTDKVSKAVP